MANQPLSNSSLELEASELDLKKLDGNASGLTKKISTVAKSTETILETKNLSKAILQQSAQTTFQTQICYVEGSPANLLVLLENAKDSKTSVERSFSRLPELQRLKDLKFYSLKTLKGCSVTKKERHLKPLSERWMKWGILSNGNCLTANTTESPNPDHVCLLSDILDKEVPRKYYLSKKAIAYLYRRTLENKKQKRGFGAVFVLRSEPLTTKDTKPEDHLSHQQLTEDMALSETEEKPMFAKTLEASYSKNKSFVNMILLDNFGGNIKERIKTDGCTWTLGGSKTGIFDGLDIRKLTPGECEDLQAFPRDWTKGLSDTRRWHVLGNAVTTNVIEDVGKLLKEACVQ